MANQTGNNQEGLLNQKTTTPSTTTNGVSVNSKNSEGNAVLVDTPSALRHNPEISVNWTPDEQLTLEMCASDSIIVRYAKVAMKLKDKTVRDVALRCRWMTKENGKRRKGDHGSARKIKNNRFIDLHLGVTGELLDQNAQMFSQISANFSASQIHDNIGLLCKARRNILTI
ncbi:F21O3.28 protein isoform 3 [Hibiscus syriacus]|uniref:F21O3.28 protein isoform 3 n=1 Tax=Hibiscus syriacus TaxID=106335 RepID=A0A6A2ZVN7_HIBSY|nr:uncharacterized protein LOC120139064 [Hibiscus syriacus]KAE8695319.1 F21O3.28 protein isoform 3 [Hibiscus syriacus]